MVNTVLVFVLIILVVITISIWLLTKKEHNVDWQVDYLRKVYPLAGSKITKDGPIFYSDLEFIFTSLLPSSEIQRLAKTSFKALIPGPSCSQLACPCIQFNGQSMPDVQFDPDPIWAGRWPMCNLPAGVTGIKDGNIELNPCCKDQASYLACLQYYKSIGQSVWASFDTYNGVPTADPYHIPEINQLWKHTLLAPFTAVVSKYPKEDWNSFYNVNGDPSNSWVEVVHAYFANEASSPAAWFYRCLGSGIFLNMGNTFIAKNKISALLQLLGLQKAAASLTNVTTFWRGNGVSTSFPDFFASIAGSLAGKTPIDKAMTLVTYIDNPNKGMDAGLTWQQLYDMNRIANTGDLDSVIESSIFDLEKTNNKAIRTVQLTVQPNLYPGWTTEILYLSDTVGTGSGDVRLISKDNLRVMDPTNPSTSTNCTFQYPFRYLYCDALKDTWLSSNLNSSVDPTQWAGCGNV